MRLPSDPQGAQLAALYREAEQHLRVAVMQAVASGQLATASYRRRMLTAIQRILAALQHDARPQAREVIRDAYTTGQQVASLAPDVGNAFGGHIHTEAVSVLADSLTRRLDDAVTHVGRQVDDIFRREQLKAAAHQLITGSTVRESSKLLVDRLTEQGVKAFTDRTGREWGLGPYAEMAVRTASREAVTQGLKNTLAQRHLDLITISSHASSCPVCRPYEGKMYSLTGATPGYPVADVLPPIHPNCRHVAYPSAANAGLPLSEDQIQARIARNRLEAPA